MEADTTLPREAKKEFSEPQSRFDSGPVSGSITPLFGWGLGLGTNAGAGMLSGGARGFLLAEGEWARVVKEGGPVLGLGFLFLRVAIVAYLGLMANAAFGKQSPLSLMIFSGVFLEVINGQFGQPTALGFASFGAGLCLAASTTALEPEIKQDLVTALEPIRKPRGRSVHAEILHQE